jgi:signal transduction histidine kinase
MATNVLNMTKVENQAILSNVTKFNLSEQLRACVLLLERKWTKKSIEFSMDFGEHLIEGDEELLKQIWLNLVDNAVKFSPEGGLVEIAIQDAEEVVRVSVINNGPEIKPDVQKRIFDKFYQAEESHSTEGSGIGLAVVKRIVELHAGTVSVHSENQLNLFMVELPKKKR